MDSVIERLWREHQGDPADLITRIGHDQDPFVKGQAAYRYERSATVLYGLPLRPSEPHVASTQWDAGALAALDAALAAGDRPAAFFAFAVLAISLRRARNFAALDELLDRCEMSLGIIPLFAHYRAMAENEKGYNPEKAVAAARHAVDVLGDHAGAHHTLALALLSLVDRGAPGPAAQTSLEAARSAVSVALRLDQENARFHLTQAQVYRHLGRIDDARREVLVARQADRDADRDPIRQRLYDYELLLINAASELDRRVAEVEKRVEDRVQGVEVRSAEIAGFITGVVALAIGGAGSAIQQKDPAAAVVVLTAVAILVFGGALVLGLVLGRRR
jgi:tetratricopeptide (TPR) repeat protein